jgi:small-conductance mechanosensitive channel
MTDFYEIFDAKYLGNTTAQWLIAGAVFLGVFFILLVIRRVTRTHYLRLAATPKQELIEVPLMVASHTALLFVFVAALFAALQSLVLPPKIDRLVQTVFTIAAFWQAGAWGTAAVLAALERKRRVALTSDRAAAGTIGIIGFIARATIWSLVLLLTLDNLGIEIKPLLAGLGIGGIAVALAVQNVLGDLFASLSITLDRPFVVGDFLSVDNFMGTVEYIGVKSTRLRSLDGEQIIMPNSNLLSSRLRNFARMTQRRVVLGFGVSQDTPREKLATLPARLRALVESHEDAKFDRSHFAKIGPNSFDFETVYILNTADFNRHMDVLQDIQLRLLEILESEDIYLAQPTQRLRVDRQVAVKTDLIPADEPTEASAEKRNDPEGKEADGT